MGTKTAIAFTVGNRLIGNYRKLAKKYEMTVEAAFQVRGIPDNFVHLIFKP